MGVGTRHICEGTLKKKDAMTQHIRLCATTGSYWNNVLKVFYFP